MNNLQKCLCNLGCGQDNLLMFFLLLVGINCFCGTNQDGGMKLGGNADNLLFFFLLLVLLMCNCNNGEECNEKCDC